MPKKKVRENYYITVVDGKKYNLLAGPYKTHEEAVFDIDRIWRITIDNFAEAAFCSVGTAKVKTNNPKPGLLNAKGLA